MAIVLIRIEAMAAEPILPLHLFRSATFSWSCAILFFSLPP
jgi:hypothetical protein